MTVHVGIFLALLCALATNLGFLYKHRGACAAADVDWKHPVRSGAALFRSRWFAIGMLVACGAWGLHVAAMAMAPLSLVQAVISGGLVFLTVMAERFFGFQGGGPQGLRGGPPSPWPGPLPGQPPPSPPPAPPSRPSRPASWSSAPRCRTTPSLSPSSAPRSRW